MILVESSAWIEYLRDTGSALCEQVDDLLRGNDVVVCDAVRLQVLAGARDEAHLRSLERLLARATTVATEPSDYVDAAALYRSCRRRGETVRKLFDCLIAAVAIRTDVPVLHGDNDFAALARHTALRSAL